MAEQALEILAVLDRNQVDYVLIGGAAVQAYGHARTTKDLDIIPAPGSENAARLAAALADLQASLSGEDAGLLGIDVTDPSTLAEAGNMTLQTRVGRLDIMPDPDGAPPYRGLRERAVVVDVAGIAVPVAGRADLIRLKRAANRPIDIEDIAVLTDPRLHPRGADLEDAQIAAPIDPVAALLGARPDSGRRQQRAWDQAVEAIGLYRNEFAPRTTPEQPLGPEPAAGRQRRVWERLADRIDRAREELALDAAVPGDLGRALGELGHGRDH